MILSREEAQQILDVLQYATGCIENITVQEEMKIEPTLELLQSRLAEPDAGANVEFPTPAYLRVSDDPVDISITDYYTEPQLRSYADARVAASRLAGGGQEPVAVVELVHQPMRGWPDGTWRQAEPQLEIRAIRPIENGQRLYAAPQGAPK